MKESLGLQIINVTGSVETWSQSLLVVGTFDGSRVDLVRRFSSRSRSRLTILVSISILFVESCQVLYTLMYLEVVTYEDSRVELTPEVVRYYLYTYEVSPVELAPEIVRTCRYYVCTV